MKIIDKYNKEVCMEALSGCVDILSDDERPLFTINKLVDGSIEISTSTVCKHKKNLLSTRLNISPKAANCVVISRPDYN